MLVKDFVQAVAERQGLGAAAKKEAGGKIFTFGSYRLGVHGPGSDIDTLIVVPGFVTRQDFFTIFEDMLHQESEISEAHVSAAVPLSPLIASAAGVLTIMLPFLLQAVPEAYVPVIKMKFSGIDIDLLFASFPKHLTIPDDLELGDNQILKGLDDTCLRSVNGSRVTDEILRLVPNQEVFRDALRAIKLWASSAFPPSSPPTPLCPTTRLLLAIVCQEFPCGPDMILPSKTSNRARHLFQRHGFPGWCRLGYAHSEDLPALP